MRKVPRLEIKGIEGLPEVRPGDDLAAILTGPLLAIGVEAGDVVVLAQKVVSKAEARLIHDGDRSAVISAETSRVLATRADLVITRTRHGFVCANAGVDASNVPEGTLSLLPEDPDGSAAAIRISLARSTGVDVAVIITDTFGRPWRRGVVNVAIGCAGLPALVDMRGRADDRGRLLEATEIALADEVAAATGLVMAKDARVPAALVRGVDRLSAPDGRVEDLIRPAADDLFEASPDHVLRSIDLDLDIVPGPVPHEALLDAFEIARATPQIESTRWRFDVLESRASRLALASATSIAPPGPVGPLMIVPSVTSSHEGENDEAADGFHQAIWMSYGAAIVALRFSLQSRGSSTRWSAAGDQKRALISDVLDIGEAWMPLGTLACGPTPPGLGRPAAISEASADVSWR